MAEISWQLLRRYILRDAGCYIELPKCLLGVVYANKFSVRLLLISFSLLLRVPILMSSVRHWMGQQSDLRTGWCRDTLKLSHEMKSRIQRYVEALTRSEEQNKCEAQFIIFNLPACYFWRLNIEIHKIVNLYIRPCWCGTWALILNNNNNENFRSSC